MDLVDQAAAKWTQQIQNRLGYGSMTQGYGDITIVFVDDDLNPLRWCPCERHHAVYPHLKECNIRRGFFEPEQFRSVKGHLPAYMQPIVEFAYITGWRTPSEILPLEWRQVDMKAGEVRLDPGTTKNDDGWVFPFTSALRRILEDQQQVAETLKRERDVIPRYVFCYTAGQKAGQWITESGFNKAWRKARVAAGCPGRIPHDFRRTAVRNLVRAGVPERVAMQLTGHKTRAVFERYNIVSSGDLRDAARRLDSFISGRTEAAG